MRTFAVILLAFAMAVVAIWLWFGGSDQAAIEFPDETAAPQASNGTAPAPAEPARGEGPQVLVEVTRRARIVPPSSPLSAIVRRGTEVLPLRAEPVAGAGASWFGQRSAGNSLVRIDLAPEHSIFRMVRLHERGAADVEVGADAAVRGRVTDGNGAPVPGARVWCGVRRGSEMVEVTTDDDGNFEGMASAGTGVPVVVRADGFAHAYRFADVDLQAAAEQRFSLLPASALTVRCAAAGQGIEQARVLVQPGPTVSTEAQQFPWFLQAIDGWVPVGKGGSAEVRNLPRGAEVAVTVRHPLAPGAAPVLVTLRQEHESLTVALPYASSLSGRVSGPDGKPLAEALVFCRGGPGESRSRHAERWLLPPDALEPGAALAVTSAEGRFLVGRPAGAAVMLTVRPPGGSALAGLEMKVTGGNELQRALTLPEWQEGKPALAVQPPGTGPWQVKVKLAGGGATAAAAFVPVEAEQVHRFELPEPMLCDITVRVASGGPLGPVQDLGRLPVVGLLEIATKR